MKKFKVKSKLKFAILSFIAVIQLFPLYWLITFSLKDNVEITGANIMGLPEVWRFENYAVALGNGGILKYFMNSVIYSGLTVVVSGLLAAMAAYGISRMKWKFSTHVFILFSIGIMIPTHATLLPLFQMLDALGLKGGYLGLLLPYITFAIPMSVMILVGFFRAIPRDLEEAAYMDGAGVFRTFFTIMLPMVRPALATASIFAFLGTWNELLFANTLIDSDALKTLPVGIMSYVGQYSTDWGVIGAGMVIATIPTIIIYALLSNHVQDGITSGAIKG